MTALREIVRTCSNVHVARAALASIGGEFAERFAGLARFRQNLVVFGVRRHVGAFQSGDTSPHSKFRVHALTSGG